MFRKNIVFDLDGITFFSRPIDGEYMDYERIIVRNHRIPVTVDRDVLLSALERAALITEERVPGAVRSSVRLDIVGGMLKVSAVSGLGSSYDEMPIRHEGDDRPLPSTTGTDGQSACLPRRGCPAFHVHVAVQHQHRAGAERGGNGCRGERAVLPPAGAHQGVRGGDAVQADPSAGFPQR